LEGERTCELDIVFHTL